MYRKCIYGVVPCSYYQIWFVKGSWVYKHNHCCLGGPCFVEDNGQWETMTKWVISIEGSSQDFDWLVSRTGAWPTARHFCVHLHYRNRIWALHQLMSASALYRKRHCFLSCRHLQSCLSINNNYARTILCIWVLIFIV